LKNSTKNKPKHLGKCFGHGDSVGYHAVWAKGKRAERIHRNLINSNLYPFQCKPCEKKSSGRLPS